MLRNYVAETATAPGTSATCNLAGAVAGRVAFSSVFASGAVCFYFMTDGTIAEWGIGTFTAGAPNTLTRTTVIGNTSGSTAKLNFTGTTTVYNETIAERVIYGDALNNVTLGGTLTVPGLLTLAVGATISTGGLTVSNGNVSVAAGSLSVIGGAITGSGGLAITGGGSIAGGLTVSSGALVLTAGGAPATAASTGTAGQIAWNSGFIYICVAANTWKRVAVATF